MAVDSKAFGKGQKMYLAIGLAAVFYLIIKYQALKKEVAWYGVMLATCALFLPASILFQGFYDKEAMLWIFPLFVWIAWFMADLVTEEGKKLPGKRGRFVPIACVILILLCGELGFINVDFSANAEWKTDRETVEVLEILETEFQKDPYICVAAPDEIQGQIRGYNAEILAVYGRDLWEEELLPYFYDGYEEWQYLLHGYMNSHLFDIIEGEEVNSNIYQDNLLELVQNSGATHVVLKKTNVIPELIMDEEKEKSVESLSYNGMELQMIEKTESYFVYRVKR